MTLPETLTKIKELAEFDSKLYMGEGKAYRRSAAFENARLEKIILSLTAALEKAVEQREHFVIEMGGDLVTLPIRNKMNQELTEILGKIVGK